MSRPPDAPGPEDGTADRRRSALARLRATGALGTRPGTTPDAPGVAADASPPVGDADAASPSPGGRDRAGPTSPPTPDLAVAAERLAARLGGRCIPGAAGPVVVAETVIRLPGALGALAALPDPLAPDARIVCLDTETTGLGTGAGTLPFLIGLGWWEEDRFRVTQIVVPDHPAEPAALAVVEAAVATDATLVTYNGRAFDWPLLVARWRLHGSAPPTPAAHLDLLPFARQVWRHRLGDARLASVEEGIAEVTRADDLPGALVPDRYFGWLRTGDPELLVDVLRHNRQDIVSLGLLLRIIADELLPAATGAPTPAVHPGDLAGLARLHLRRRRHAEALACLEAAASRTPLRDPSGLAERIAVDRARLLARAGRPDEAAVAWEAVALDGGALAGLAWIALAKDREHRLHDPAGAWAATERAAALALRRRLAGRPDRLVERDLGRRTARLTARLATLRAAPGPRPGHAGRVTTASAAPPAAPRSA